MCKKIVTCEYVSFGHPDKIADQIADAILDEYLKVDPNVRAGIEVLVIKTVLTVHCGGKGKNNFCKPDIF